MPEQQIAVVEIRMEERDGIFYAFSKDMPELHLCADKESKLYLDIPCMIKALYRLNFNKNVRVERAANADLKPFGKTKLSNGNARFLAMPEALAA
jgi:hypothetical protein